MSEEEIINNLKEIIELSKEEIEKENENITAILDLKDLKSLNILLDLYNKEKEKNKELEYSLKNNVVTKYCIRHKADDYESKGYIEIAGAMRELLEERN